VALAAVLAPAAAARLLSRLGGPGSADAQGAGGRLAGEPRHARLAALAAALAEVPTPAAGGATPLLRRLSVETALDRSAPRPGDREPAAQRFGRPSDPGDFGPARRVK
jgi:hypothetical protein